MTASPEVPSLIQSLLAATNAFDADGALALFAPNAVIDDPSTGESFVGTPGVRDYVERFFIGYHTVSRLLSVTALDDGRARARVDFTGDFGHEIGSLDVVVNEDGRIISINADLE